jgi:hypothetical protein
VPCAAQNIGHYHFQQASTGNATHRYAKQPQRRFEEWAPPNLQSALLVHGSQALADLVTDESSGKAKRPLEHWSTHYAVDASQFAALQRTLADEVDVLWPLHHGSFAFGLQAVAARMGLQAADSSLRDPPHV